LAICAASPRSAPFWAWSSPWCYCFGPGAAEVRKVRVEQELLSRQPGTEEIFKRFDQLDGQVGDLHEQATRNMAILWVAVASVSMLGWYKIT
jgi:hypothetical protein